MSTFVFSRSPEISRRTLRVEREPLKAIGSTWNQEPPYPGDVGGAGRLGRGQAGVLKAQGGQLSILLAPADHIAQAIGIGDWQPLGASLNNSVYSLALRGNTLFAGGTFTQTGVLGLENIAAWDLLGSHWSNLGSGADGPILSVATDANFVYAGGLFGAAGGKVSNFLGRWGQYQLFLPTLRR